MGILSGRSIGVRYSPKPAPIPVGDLIGVGDVIPQGIQHKITSLVGIVSDYDCKIRYHTGKVNVVSDALSRKERNQPLRVRALVMTISLDLPKQILKAQTKARKPENLEAEDVSWLYESHKSKYSVHPGSDKMYQDMK
ncbi:hypothetical protein Tco_1200678 [Tanacetum coccineum]